MDSTEFEQLKAQINEYLESNLKPTRLAHTRSVAELAVKMARQYGVDEQKAELAALLHDMVRNISIPVMNIYVERLGLPDRYLDNMNLAHGKIGASLARTGFGIEDEEILNAISYHTTGRADMSLLEKIIFLADAIEPLRNYQGVDRIRAKADESLDAGCMESLGRTIEFLKKKGVYIDEDTVEAYEFLVNEAKV
ncbi:MAG: bis(5'-nucleosyl)-tetraphosphatase (symmetrical) YqeK [Clostridia bacterium]|nr:bis(5'-nucleosyl)-tetraphosphatase (symmetrical) YqeK [Clostridia bacterium]